MHCFRTLVEGELLDPPNDCIHYGFCPIFGDWSGYSSYHKREELADSGFQRGSILNIFASTIIFNVG
ncbi:hypothetical protein KSP39_PZI007244 [Platanthera zijinensis]|uniref:Uncharacterized protein n=1 Tax=Platanthera zijinensis TaxID=2320716 RepID=A0AAP0BNW0_9ASPA